MADSTLDSLRKDAIARRIKGTPGGNRVMWSAKDAAVIRDVGMALSEFAIRGVPAALRSSPSVESIPALSTFSLGGITVNRDAQSNDLDFACILTKRVRDLVNDIVETVDCSDFNKNPVVAPFHNTSILPIARSSPPYVSGDSLLAVMHFPAPGISAASDEIAAAIRAKLIRGISISFIPLKWKFSTDPSRPMGVDFQSVKLLEFSVVSVPCCPPCLILGAVSGKSASTASAAPLVPADSARQRRVAEAAKFRRLAYRV